MVKNTLIVKFDHSTLDPSSNESLCISKKVNGIFNAVFHNASPKPRVGQKKLLNTNTFKFTTDYQVFVAHDYQNDSYIDSVADPKGIAVGQVVEWQDNDLTEPETADAELLWGDMAKSSFAVKNVPERFHVGVNASTGRDWSPIFVDPGDRDRTSDEPIIITPKNEYVLYWSNVREAEYIHEVSENDAFKFSFPPGDSTLTIRFGYKVQDEPVDGREDPKFYIDE